MRLNTNNDQPVLDYAIIGAGIAGLSAANSLSELGYQVEVFEKSRGTGGRLCSKKVLDSNGNEMAFDLGCNEYSAQRVDFSKQLEKWHLKGIIAPWDQDHSGSTRYVGVTRNSALTRYLSKEVVCHFSTRITQIAVIDELWVLYKEVDGLKDIACLAKQVILALPAQQAYDLLPASHAYEQLLAQVKVGAQWVMAIKLVMDRSRILSLDPSQSDVIQLMSHETNKPQRSSDYNTEIIKLHAEFAWSEEHKNSSADIVYKLLLQELESLFGSELNILQSYCHRWLYSQVIEGIDTCKGYLDDGAGLIILGDYLQAELSGLESAWLSAKLFTDNLSTGNDLS